MYRSISRASPGAAMCASCRLACRRGRLPRIVDQPGRAAPGIRDILSGSFFSPGSRRCRRSCPHPPGPREDGHGMPRASFILERTMTLDGHLTRPVSDEHLRAAPIPRDGARARRRRLGILSLTALGVVYGDIGTSPLYAFRACFSPEMGLPRDTAAVYGVLSLIVWSLILVVTVKYILVIMRLDNRGEGGILALLALILQKRRSGLLVG